MTKGITLKKNVKSGTVRHQEERKELARNQSKDHREIEEWRLSVHWSLQNGNNARQTM
jgi:hypothetical protein